MTQIITHFHQLFCEGKPKPFSGDRTRWKEFSQDLCEKFNVSGTNLIEQATWALTSIGSACGDNEILFGCHIDQFNCVRPNYNIVCCFYFHFYKNNIWYRVAMIGYSRKSISDCSNRKYGFDML